jgi:subtilisin family serine protease
MRNQREDRKRFIVVENGAARKQRRPTLEFRPQDVLAETVIRGTGSALGPLSAVTIPVAAVSEVAATSRLLLAALSSRVPQLLIELQQGARATFPEFAARRGRGRRPCDLDTALAMPDVELSAPPSEGLALIEATQAAVDALRRSGLTVVEDKPVYPATARPPAVPRRRQPGSRETVEVSVTSLQNGKPIRAATVVGRLADGDIDARQTNARGLARLDVTGSRLQDLWVDAVPGHWSWVGRDLASANRVTVSLQPLAPDHVDGLRHRYPEAALTAGEGVCVAVIDTGVGPHPAIEVDGGMGFEPGPTAASFEGVFSSHGTHVAGIIASRAPGPQRGLAPGVRLRSYRIYEGDEASTTFSLTNAIAEAVRDGCDVINLSLELEANDFLVRQGILRALDAGVIVVAAAGNGGRRPLAFPASIDGVLAAGALGRIGTYPLDVASAAHACGPPGGDPDDYVADFSNLVRRNDFVAPGVGVISTLKDGAWGIMDGTSQAAPVVSAMAARVLDDSGLARRERSVQRARAVLAEMRRRADTLGFPVDLEGKGLVQ